MIMEGKFAFVDLETTGSSPSRGRVIEVAIVRVEDGAVIDRWSSLVNPGVPIPSFIQGFTGINQDMLIDKPIFEELAEEILEKLEGYTFVAHNVKFDFNFLKHEFARCGYKFRMKDMVCTVKMSRFLYSDYKKHNLDAIAGRFNLEAITDRHRALGDADLLYQFWLKVAKDFKQEEIDKALNNQKGKTRIPSQIDNEEFEKLPERPGVYLFYGVDKDRPIYIGKSKNIKSRVLSHFTENYNSFRKTRMVKQIRRIEYLPKAGELSALLTEADLVKKHLPIFNKKLRKQKILYGLRLEQKDLTSGILKPRIVKMINPDEEMLTDCYGPFRSKAEIDAFLERIVAEYKLCRLMLGIESERRKDGVCFNFEMEKCLGTCNELSSTNVDQHNTILKKALEKKQYQRWPFEGTICIMEKCKHSRKKEFHLVKNWCLLGSFNSKKSMQSFLANGDFDINFDLDKYNLLRGYMKRDNTTYELVEK